MADFSRISRALLPLALLVFAQPARADDVHYQDYPVGNRATGLAGAFGAIANDPSGIFYNPAGIVDVSRNNVSVSTSLYGLASNAPTPLSGFTSADFARLTLNVIPSEIGATTVIGEMSPNHPPKMAWGFDVVVPSSVSETNQSSGTASAPSNETRVLTNQTLWVGAGIAYRYDARWSFGISAFYRHREVSLSDVNYSGATAPATGPFNDSSTSLSAYDDSLLAKLGVRCQINPEWAAGITLETPSVYLRSGGQALVTDASWSGSGAPSFATYTADTTASPNAMKLETQTMGAFRLAGAYVLPKVLTVTVDVTGYMPSSYNRLQFPKDSFGNTELEEALGLPLHIQTEYTMNVAAGFEWLINKTWSVAGGFYTDRSASPNIPGSTGSVITDGQNTLPHVDLYGGSLAIGYFGEHSLTRLGVTGNTGAGSEAVYNASSGAWVREPLAQSAAYLFVASTFRY